MMRICFNARSGGYWDDDYALVCGVDGVSNDGTEHVLLFNRVNETISQEDPDEDWGVHTEFDDQNNGAYDAVRKCDLTRTALTVELSRQLGKLKNVEGFDVLLGISDEDYEQLKIGLDRVFRGMSGVLNIKSGG